MPIGAVSVIVMILGRIPASPVDGRKNAARIIQIKPTAPDMTLKVFNHLSRPRLFMHFFGNGENADLWARFHLIQKGLENKI
jgi:hypothetical protein